MLSWTSNNFAYTLFSTHKVNVLPTFISDACYQCWLMHLPQKISFFHVDLTPPCIQWNRLLSRKLSGKIPAQPQHALYFAFDRSILMNYIVWNSISFLACIRRCSGNRTSVFITRQDYLAFCFDRPFGDGSIIRKKKVFWPYNKFFIDQACLVKIAGCWPRSFLHF